MNLYKNCKEQLLVIFLTHKFRLNKYDSKFLNNLSILISKNNRITSNQAELFDKLVLKYKRQFSKNKINIDEMLQLPWKTPMIATTSEYTEAFLSIHNDKLKLRVPFNKDYIKALREVDNLQFVLWDRNDKCYYATFYTTILKSIINITQKFFVLNISNDIQLKLDIVNEYKDIKYWNPTLVKNNNNYYILACNQYLNESIKHIPLNNDPKSLLQLSRHGVNIDESLTTNKFLKFVGSFSPVIDLTELSELQAYCRELNIDTIIYSYRIKRIKDIKEQVDKHFGIGNFKTYYDGMSGTRKIVNGISNRSIYLYYGSQVFIPSMYLELINCLKVVKLTNSNPVEIK